MAIIRLWMLVCIPIFALARFRFDPALANSLASDEWPICSDRYSSLSAHRQDLCARHRSDSRLFWVFSYDVLINVYQQGLESGIAAFFIVLLAYELFKFEKSWRKADVSRVQISRLAIIAVLVIFSRLDLVFLAGIAGIWIVFRRHLLRYFLPLDIVSFIVATLAGLSRQSGYSRLLSSDIGVARAMVAWG